MMGGDDYEVFDELKQERQRVAARRRYGAAAIFPEARDLASTNGLLLHRCTQAHYQLQRRLGDTTILNIYPGNQRLYRQRGPVVWFDLPEPWGLLDVVRAVIAKGKP